MFLFLFLFLCVFCFVFFPKMKDFILEAHFQMPSSLNLTYPMTFQFPQTSRIANKKLISRGNSYYIGRNWQLGNFAIINQSQDGVFPYLLKYQHTSSVFFLYSFITCIYYCLWLTCSVYFDLNPEHTNAGYFNTKPIEITMIFTGGFQYKESINEQQGGKMANFDNHIF